MSLFRWGKSRGWEISVASVAGIFLFGISSSHGFSGAKPGPSASPVKMVVALAPIQGVTISIPQAVIPSPDSSSAPTYDFGPNLSASLCAKLRQTHFILNLPEQDLCGASAPTPVANAAASPTPAPSAGGGVQWDGHQVVPAATFSFSVDALALRTGGHGDRMFYGFDERLRTPFNDGYGTETEEFPLTVIQFQQWFDRTFQDQGIAPFDTQSGLDLGQGFDFNAVIAQAGLKYESYNAVIRMHVTMDAPLAGRHEVKTVQVKGGGLFFDVVGGYELWSGAIGIARTDAMNAAFNNAFAASYQLIDEWAQTLPLTAVVFQVSGANEIYLNTGADSNIPVGTKYSSPGNSSLVLEVTEFVPGSGSVAKLDSGSLTQVQKGMQLVQLLPQPAPSVAAQLQARVAAGAPSISIKLPNVNLPKADFAAGGVQIQDGFWQSVLGTVVGGTFLSYRIWRYFEYDEAYLGPDWQQKEQAAFDCQLPDADSFDLHQCYQGQDYSSKDSPSADLPQGAENWATRLKSEPWAKQIGLDVAPAMTAAGPVVAIIDSGVDYNHPALNERIWVNPAPTTDPDGNTDTNGWDFISGDPRPFDDGYHGTEVASLVVGVAPLVQIMPLKVFNPFGITSSAAIYGAFQYAVDHGAKIIVAAWATQKKTKTIEQALKYAHDHGVAVVVSAGDRGDDLSKSPSYPVALAKNYDNVVAVTGVDTQDQLVKVESFYANYDPASVTIAAPGEQILVAQPRSHTSHDTSTALSAALVAGALARDWAAVGGTGTYQDWIKALKEQSQAVPALASGVAGGLRLRVK
jgi:hypothetical protein